MQRTDNPARLAILGAGEIGRRLLGVIPLWNVPGIEIAVFARPDSVARIDRRFVSVVFTDATDLIAWKPSVAVECAGHHLVQTVVPSLLAQGTDVVIASIGALANESVREGLRANAASGGGRIVLVSGAIGGLDALAACRLAGLREVRYVGTKPARAWLGTPAEATCDLAALRAPAVIFDGNAGEAATRFPKNANVAAAVALAGAGFERTQVRLIADPASTENVHEIFVNAACGTFTIRLQNSPLPENPKTSWLAALSVEAELASYFGLDGLKAA